MVTDGRASQGDLSATYRRQFPLWLGCALDETPASVEQAERLMSGQFARRISMASCKHFPPLVRHEGEEHHRAGNIRSARFRPGDGSDSLGDFFVGGRKARRERARLLQGLVPPLGCDNMALRGANQRDFARRRRRDGSKFLVSILNAMPREG